MVLGPDIIFILRVLSGLIFLIAATIISGDIPLGSPCVIPMEIEGLFLALDIDLDIGVIFYFF
jgi:hypothetical protein